MMDWNVIIAGVGSMRNTPLNALFLVIALSLLPWLWQVQQSRSSLVGASPADNAAERLWRRVALVAVPLLVTLSFLAKTFGVFESWTQW